MDSSDYDRQRTFMRLTEKERFERLYNMVMNMAANRAQDTKLNAELLNEVNDLRRILTGISHRKDDTLTTNEKIAAAMDKSNPGWRYYRDRVLPGTLTAIQTVVFLAVLYLAFGGKLTP